MTSLKNFECCATLQLKWCIYNGLVFFFFQRAQAALHAVTAIQSGGLALTGGPTGESLMLSGQSPVLRIIVENLFYPVTLEVLHQVWAK